MIALAQIDMRHAIVGGSVFVRDDCSRYVHIGKPQSFLVVPQVLQCNHPRSARVGTGQEAYRIRGATRIGRRSRLAASGGQAQHCYQQAPQKDACTAGISVAHCLPPYPKKVRVLSLSIDTN